MTDPAPTEIDEPRSAAGYLAPLAVLFVGTVLVLLFVAPGLLRRGGGLSLSGDDQGPLSAGDATAVSAPHNPGDVLTFGHVAVFNTGRVTAVLDRVSFEPPLPDNLRLLGIQVASDPDRDLHTVGAVDGYPPPRSEIGSLQPLKGAKVYPENTPEGERGAPLIMGFRFDGGDLASFKEVHVDYHVGGRKYRAKLDKVFIVCSWSAYPDGCPDRDEVYPSE